MTSQLAVAGGEVPRHMEWNGIWTGYMTFAGVALILLSFVLAVGFSSLNPFSAASWRSAGGMTLGWSVVMVLIATFLGCWVAARTPRTTKQHGMMRGITLWGMILLTVLFVVGSVAGTAVSALASASPAAAAVAPAATTPAAPAAATPGATTPATGAAATRPAPGAVQGAATTAGAAAQSAGAHLMWGFFWIALIGLGLALLAGAIGGGGVSLPGRGKVRPTNQPAA